ncbi:hypothetical protein LTR66_017206 [Elasticomyces elasticus]|nr:hypothetical protein LTR66_017206 [Elasticomyces elasticus]
MDDQIQDGQEQGARRSFQQFPQRSTASVNWRSKDDTPRADPQPRAQGQRAQLGDRQQSDANSTRLYVGNLLYTASKDDIANFFAEHGFTTTNISMTIDPETGRNPSYCFCDFGSADEANNAMNQLNGQEVMGRNVRINPEQRRQQGEGSGLGGQQRQSYGERSYGQQSQGGYQSRFNNTNSGATFNNAVTQSTEGPSKRLYIGNLPDITAEAESTIQSLLQQIGLEISNVSKLIAPHESKREMPGDHYYLFVDLARPEDADSAIEQLNNQPVDLRGDGNVSTLRVNKAREQSRENRPKREYVPRAEGQSNYQQREGGYQQREGGYGQRREGGNRGWRGGPAEETA